VEGICIALPSINVSTISVDDKSESTSTLLLHVRINVGALMRRTFIVVGSNPVQIQTQNSPASWLELISKGMQVVVENSNLISDDAVERLY